MSVDIVTPSHPQYWQYRDTDSARGAPAEVLLPSSATEVAACLQRAAQRGGPLSVRSGGHGTIAPATNDGGTVVDLRRMCAVAVPETPDGVARIGAGARLGDAVSTLGRVGLALSTGDAGDVGVGGTVVAGGIGLLGRAAGLFIDRVERLEVVTAAGAVAVLSRDAHPDAFAATLGGEPSAVITEVAVRPVALAAVRHAVLVQQPTDLAAYLEGWAQLARDAPRAVTAFCYVFLTGAAPTVQTTIVVAHTVDGSAAIERFAGLAAVRAHEQRVVPYAAVVPCTGAPLLAEHDDHSRTVLLERLDARTSRDLAAVVLDGTAAKLELRAMGGAIGDVVSAATAFRQRTAELLVRTLAPGADAPSADVLDAAWAPIIARGLGSYAGLESPPRPSGGSSTGSAQRRSPWGRR